MGISINKVTVMGHLGADPDLKQFPDGGLLVNLSVATTEKWKDRQTGAPMEETEWHKVVLKGRLAEIARDYLQKGSQVCIEGRLRTRKWQNQQGTDCYTTEILARDMQMGSRPGSTAQQPQQRQQPAQQGGYQQPQQRQQPAQQGGYQQPQQPAQQGGYQQPQQSVPAGGDTYEDKLPF